MAKKSRMIICVRCPKGCEIQANVEGESVTDIEGNVCKLGTDYVKDEILNPKRIVTTTVRVKNGEYPLVPVWTIAPVPKDKIFNVLEELRRIELEAPVRIGQIVLENVSGTGISVETSGNNEKKRKTG